MRSAFDVAADLIDPPEDPYRNDPVGWVTDRLDGFLWSAQRRIAESVRDHRYTAVQSAHDLGKSACAAMIVCWWLSTHPVGDAFAVTTAPTTPQVEAILWREIGRWHRKGRLPGRITLDARWRVGPGDELVAYGRKPADHDQAAFQGVHSLHPLIVLDEAGGIPRSLYDAVDALATNENARVLAVGNPDDPTSHFATVCKPGSGWNVIHLDGLASPNFTGEPVPDWLRPLLLSPTWVEERRQRWGEGSPLWDAKVRGLFPKVSTDGLVEPGWALAAQHRTLPAGNPVTLGVDVARFGADSTVIVLRQGGRVRVIAEQAKGATTETTGLVRQAIREHRPADGGPIRTLVDAVGIGAGVYDQLKEQGENVTEMIGGATPRDPKQFFNARAEWYWHARELFELGEIDIDPADDDLVNQLQAIRWRVDGHGRIHMETKEEMVKRGMPSPDRADACVYALADQLVGEPWTPPPVPPRGRPAGLSADLLQRRW